MQKSAHFRVDPKLAHVLGESYTSSEKALKELVDNAWDAEATEVHVTVPNILTDAPIIVQDNGSGMKTAELEAEYQTMRNGRETPCKAGSKTLPFRHYASTCHQILPRRPPRQAEANCCCP